jgi:gliding motility-associated-like protein
MKYLILTLLLSIGVYAQPVEPIDSIPQGPPTPPQAEIYVFIPNIITPNGDGINDRFELILQPNYKVEMKVYSRWGSLVYRNDDYQNDFYGTGLADGVYAFHIRVYEGSRYRDYFKMITLVQ